MDNYNKALENNNSMRFDTSPVKGTKDSLPENEILLQYITQKIRLIFKRFGFDPLETPALESMDILAAKGAGGPEILKETYNFKDQAGRRIGLRYDLTVPLARVIARFPNLPKPFKRYQITKVWRYGDVAKGRLREFYQCDIDTVGSKSMLADAEIIACIIAVFEDLGFKNFTVRINNRKLLTALIEYAGVEKGKVIDALRSIDKLDKVGINGVEKELISRGINKKSADKIIKLIRIQGKPEKVFSQAEKILKTKGEQGIQELKELISYLNALGVSSKVKIDLSLARGLDYYTGPIFEVEVDKSIGSLAGGGRYDKMIGVFSGKEIPATGISIGLERIMAIMQDKRPKEVTKTLTNVFVISATKNVTNKAIEIAQNLRKKGISVEIELMDRNFSKQLDYANKKEISYVVIVGEKELKSKCVVVKNMKTGKQKTIKMKDLEKELWKK